MKNESQSIVLVNTLPWVRNEVINVTIMDAVSDTYIFEIEGIKSILNRDDRNNFIGVVDNIPALSMQSYEIHPVDKYEVTNDNFILTNKVMENDYYRISFDDDYVWTSIYDKKLDKEILSEPKGNLLTIYEDKPRIYDNWEIDTYYKEKKWDVLNVEDVSIIDKGPNIKQLKITRNIFKSKIVQTISFYRNSRRIDFDTHLDWKNHNMFMKVSFPHKLNSNYATFEIPYGNIKRETHNNTSWDEAKYEVCGHRWADISQFDYGFSIISKYKYGYEAKGNIISLSLVKAGTDPNPNSDIEKHDFSYSILVHEGSWENSNVVQEAYSRHYPVYTNFLEEHQNGERKGKLLEFDASSTILEVIKIAEKNDDTIIRLYEYKNSSDKIKIKFNEEILDCWLVNGMEEKLERINIRDNEIVVDMMPYEIKSIRVRRK